MTHHFVPVHSGGSHGLSSTVTTEESRLTEFDRDLPTILAPRQPSLTSFSPNSSIVGNPLPRIETNTRPDFKVVYVSGGEDVRMTAGANSNDAPPRGTMFTALFFFLSALFAKIFHGLNRCRPSIIGAGHHQPQQRHEGASSFSAIEVERIEEELRKQPKKTQKANAPVY